MYSISILISTLINLNNDKMAKSLEEINCIAIPKKEHLTEYANYYTICLISYASKIVNRMNKCKLKSYMERKMLDVPNGFRKDGGTLDIIADVC